MPKTTKVGSVYVLRDYNLECTYKIGVTTRDIQIRLKELNQCPGAAVKLVYLSPKTENYRAIEKKLHAFFSAQRTRTGENKSLSEWFYLPSTHASNLMAILQYTYTNV